MIPGFGGWGSKESQKKKTIPLWLHGDGVEFSTDTLLTFPWGPSLFTPQGLQESQEEYASHSMDSSFLVTAWPKSATDSKTWDSIASPSGEACKKATYKARLFILDFQFPR